MASMLGNGVIRESNASVLTATLAFFFGPLLIYIGFKMEKSV